MFYDRYGLVLLELFSNIVIRLTNVHITSEILTLLISGVNNEIREKLKKNTID